MLNTPHNATPLTRTDMRTFEIDLSSALALDGGEVNDSKLRAFLLHYFGSERGAVVRAQISEDLLFFRDNDPASTNYTEAQILSVRRGMAAIAAHRIFAETLRQAPELLYDIEVVAKYVQKDTNVEIHPSAQIGVPFAIDHGHGTVIGATARIGRRTFIYHGVTLGATGKRSRADRRHPIVGDNVFFGNGSQVLGPSIIENDVSLASGVLIRDSYVCSGVKISLNVRIAGVVVPRGARIFGSRPDDLTTYFAQFDDMKQAEWVELERYDVTSND
ncbi:MAG: hypothetical protein Kow0059_06660 [Candidatus Sumerlaeia bacterium]